MPVIKGVFNYRYGGFGLSEKASQLYTTLSGKDWDENKVSRTDPFLVQVVETLGKEANDIHSLLFVDEIVEDYWEMTEYDGMETVRPTVKPKIDVQKLVEDESLGNDEKIQRLKEAYRLCDVARAEWKSLGYTRPI